VNYSLSLKRKKVLYIGHEVLDIHEIGLSSIGIFLKRRKPTKMELLGRLMAGYDLGIKRGKIKELESLI
jgi:hypothetical protein